MPHTRPRANTNTETPTVPYKVGMLFRSKSLAAIHFVKQAAVNAATTTIQTAREAHEGNDSMLNSHHLHDKHSF